MLLRKPGPLGRLTNELVYPDAPPTLPSRELLGVAPSLLMLMPLLVLVAAVAPPPLLDRLIAGDDKVLLLLLMLLANLLTPVVGGELLRPLALLRVLVGGVPLGVLAMRGPPNSEGGRIIPE
jgi:hypothetical protein